MRTISRDIVSALIFSKDGKIFQGRKDPSKGGVYADCWHIPGGGIENGENKEQALVREIKEETGIDLSPYKIELVDDTGKGEALKTVSDTQEQILVKMSFNVYKVRITDKSAEQIEVQLDDDLASYHWIDPSEIKNYKLTPPSIDLFKKLGYL